jgi:hypothetical protein
MKKKKKKHKENGVTRNTNFRNLIDPNSRFSLDQAVLKAPPQCFGVFPKKVLYRDLYSRRPGTILRWDGAYGAARKMILLDDIPELCNVLLLVYKTYGHIISFGFGDGESAANWQILHYFIYLRCNQKERESVIYGYDDLG